MLESLFVSAVKRGRGCTIRSEIRYGIFKIILLMPSPLQPRDVLEIIKSTTILTSSVYIMKQNNSLFIIKFYLQRRGKRLIYMEKRKRNFAFPGRNNIHSIPSIMALLEDRKPLFQMQMWTFPSFASITKHYYWEPRTRAIQWRPHKNGNRSASPAGWLAGLSEEEVWKVPRALPGIQQACFTCQVSSHFPAAIFRWQLNKLLHAS